MTYRSIIVYLDLEHSNEPALRMAREVATRFNAKIIGIAAGLPARLGTVGGAFSSCRPHDSDADHAELHRAIDRCKTHFYESLEDLNVFIEWRSDVASPADFLATESRAADLLVVGRPEMGLLHQSFQHLDIADAVMKTGRPMLVVPPGKTYFGLNSVLIAWKDTIEARRAVSASLPLLRRAQNVLIAEIVDVEREKNSAAQRVADVAKWLERHKITASATAELSAGDPGGHLEAIARERRADIVVAGPYGHSRQREWVFGGVTLHLLHMESTCALLTH